MSARQRGWARLKREEMFDALGRVCKTCGATKDLEFDCIVPRGHRHHKMEWSARTSFYRRQLREENLQVLCGKCNARKGASEEDLDVAPLPLWIWPEQQTADCPF